MDLGPRDRKAMIIEHADDPAMIMHGGDPGDDPGSDPGNDPSDDHDDDHGDGRDLSESVVMFVACVCGVAHDIHNSCSL